MENGALTEANGGAVKPVHNLEKDADEAEEGKYRAGQIEVPTSF